MPRTTAASSSSPTTSGTDRTIVLKFGSSVLPGEPNLPTAVHEIYRWLREGYRVVAIVSALGNTTDTLLEQARRYSDEATAGTVSALLATGELRSSALLALALDRAGVPATTLDHAAIGLTTEGPTLDARATGLDVARVRAALSLAPVLVIPGFLGRSASGETTLLGRGGSDLTALFIASRLGAECRLLKDVDGLYDHDPANRSARPAQRYARIAYDDVLALSEGIVQHKAVRFAREHGQAFTVARCGDEGGTLVNAGPTAFATPATSGTRPLRVALLGLGTVGRGVYDELRRHPDRFHITRVLVRNTAAHVSPGVPAGVLTTDPEEVLRGDPDGPPDLIVELLGGEEPARSLVRRALTQGIHVVSGNKLALAPVIDDLHTAAAEGGATLAYSAAVGGATPVLELAHRGRRLCADTGGLAEIRGVLNGTSTYILTRLGEGFSFEQALSEAQKLGYAEADPSADVDGLDAASKLSLLVREAFGRTLPFKDIRIQGIRTVKPDDVTAAARSGKVIRLVATARLTPPGLEATVSPQTLDAHDPLSRTGRASSAVCLTAADGRTFFASGGGAGRYPTTEAVIADLLDLWRTCTPSIRPERHPPGGDRPRLSLILT